MSLGPTGRVHAEPCQLYVHSSTHVCGFCGHPQEAHPQTQTDEDLMTEAPPKPKPIPTLEDIFNDIKNERDRQDIKWGGPDHDDDHMGNDWVAYITRHLGKSVFWPLPGPPFRYQMVRIAALAISAIQWYDRGNSVGFRRYEDYRPSGSEKEST